MKAELKSHVLKIWHPGPKVQNGGENEFFCSWYNELAFLCNGTYRHEIGTKNVNRSPLLDVNRRIMKIFH